jgi:hypothetical protein
MQFVRKALLVLVGVAFPALLFATAFDFGVLHVVGSPTPVKKILSDSGIYNSVVGSALDQAKKSSTGGSEVSLTDPLIKKAAEDSFSPQVVKDSTEKVIDGVYDWLDGKSAQPDFNVDLSSVKSSFAENAAGAAKFRAESLPACTALPDTTDPLSITCLPQGVTPAQVADQVKNNVLTGQGFLEHPNITASSVKSEGSDQSVFDNKLKDTPKQYQRVKKTPFILATLTVAAILAIIFLSVTRRKGLRHVGVTMSVVGAFMLLFAWGLNRVAVHNAIPKISMDNKVLQSNVQHLATDLVHSVDKNYWVFGAIYLGLGVLAILIAMLLGRGGNNKKSSKPPAPASDTPAPAAASPARKAPQKPKSTPRIQG